jgi:hypothetical protein
MKYFLLIFLAFQVSTCNKKVKPSDKKTYTDFGTCYNDLETTGKLDKCKGKIIKINDELWAIQPENNETQRYGICQIPEELKKENLNIIFSGEIKKIAPNVRYAAGPFTIKELKVVDK